MKKNFTLHVFLFVLFFLPLVVLSQVKLSTYATGAPIRPGNLTEDDRQELIGAGIIPVEEKDGPSRLAKEETSPFHAATHKAMACPAAFNMNTPYNSNNGQRGCMFDVFAANTVTIRCFESNLYAGTTANYEIYWRAGTHVGNENNSGAWTFIGGATGITSAGNNLPTALPIPVNVTIPAGATYSFYITNDFGGGTSYTDGTAVGNFLASDANLTVYEGVGKSYPFGLTFTVRNFNGHIFYDFGGALDADKATLQAAADPAGVHLNWELGSETQLNTLALQRSADGLTFAEIANWNASENPATWYDAASGSDQYFYRLALTDQQGEISFSNVAEVQLETGNSLALENVFPNPFGQSLSLQLRSRNEEILDMRIVNQIGQVVHREAIKVSAGINQIEMDFPKIAAGMYTLFLQGKDGQVVRKVVRE